MSEYAKRDAEALGEFYTRHVSAMTAEGLHDKADIAAELAHRDAVIADLVEGLRKAEDGDFQRVLANYRRVRRAAIAKATQHTSP